MNECKLEEMFDLRLSFMKMMKEKIPGSYPEFPVDISKKASQQVCRDLALKGVEEMFEALQHLKNWKPHRVTNVEHELDREEFLEEESWRKNDGKGITGHHMGALGKHLGGIWRHPGGS
jgi:hypothetical protein